jgi:hypothetical protein
MDWLTPQQDALCAHKWNFSRGDLPSAAQRAYDRLRADPARLRRGLDRLQADLDRLQADREREAAETGWSPFELPPVDGPSWTSDRLAISPEWVAFKAGIGTVPWNLIRYEAVSSVRSDETGGIVVSRPAGLGVLIDSTVLASLEACTVLDAGLGANPAVAPAASRLLRFYLARARRAVPRHTVDRSGTIHTFRSMRAFHLVVGIACVVLGAGLLVSTAAAVAYPHSSWGQGISTWGAIWSTALSLLFIWVGIRMTRVEVQISAKKITIRGYLHTRTVKASEIRAITLQPGGANDWQPRVELTDGRSFYIPSFSCGSVRNPPIPARAAAVEEARKLLGVRPDDAGKPVSRQPGGAPAD